MKALAHITGGGLTENIPRVLPPELGVRIDLACVPVLPVFQWLAWAGGIAEAEMLRTFNCGVGMVAITAPNRAGAVEAAFAQAGHSVVPLGEVVEAGGDRVAYTGRLALGT